MSDESRIEALVERLWDSHRSVAEVCKNDPELMSQVRQRWERIRRVENQIEALFPPAISAHESVGVAMPDTLPQIEGYAVDGILGRGGMGIVYSAKHLKLNRPVALKMLLAGIYASPNELARFLRESQAIALLQHPHIVQIHDAGELEGRPYFTMEFVAGGSLGQGLAGTPQLARRAAEVVVSLAEGIQLAHDNGIVHRDLKPANILLAVDGTPKIADFGLAWRMDGGPALTMTGARVGTPSYMAPEQALGKSGAIGPSVDIYALGAILYEMLTGRPPFRAETAIETQRQVVTVDAVPPSRLNANVPRYLETICLTCLHKDPSRRYSSAAELADDLRRFLAGQPVRARPVRWPERVWRWGKRNRGVAAAMAGVAALMAVIVVGSLGAAAHFRKLESDQRRLAVEKGKLVVETVREREKAVLAENREANLRRQSEAQSKELRNNLYLTEMNLGGQAAAVPSGLGRVGELLTRWGKESPDLRNWEWYYLNGLSHRNLSNLMTHGKYVHNVAWSPGGSRLASAGSNGTICIWDDFDDGPPLRINGHTREVYSVAWSPDGRRLASASWDHTVRVWDANNGTEHSCFHGHTAETHSVSWSPDGKTIASGGRDQTIRIWDADSGTLCKILRGHAATVAGLAWHPDGRRLASASHDRTVRIWDVASEGSTHTLTGHYNWVNQVAWSPDGSRLASASGDETLRIWDPDTGQEPRILEGHTQGVTSVAWSPNGRQLASSSDDQTVKVWSADTGVEAFSLRGHGACLTTVAWNSKGDRLASGGYESVIKVWEASVGPETPSLSDHEAPVQALAWCQRGSKLCASADAAGRIKIWDFPRNTVRWSHRGDEHHVSSVAWHPAGTHLAVASGNGMIRIWSIGTGKDPEVLDGHSGGVLSVSWSPDGRRLASGGYDETIRIWDVTSRKTSQVIVDHHNVVYSVAWSPDGRRLASASADHTVKIWDAATGEEVQSYQGHSSQVMTVAWSPDGKMLASAGSDQTVHLWDSTTGQKTLILRGHSTHIAQVIWSPDGTRVASAGKNGTVKIWDKWTGKEALTIVSHTSQVTALAWSPDGMILASAGFDHQIRIHNATSGYMAARSPQLLSAISRRLADDPSQSADWQLRAEIYAQSHDWKQAAVNISEYFLLQPHRNWLMLDCVFAGPYSADLMESCPPEEDDFFGIKSPDDVDAGISGSVNWTKVPDSSQGLVDFGALTEHRDHVSCYALFPIYCRDDRQVAILIGTDDQSRLWLNGERLYESMRSRPAVRDEDAISANLKSGWNALLVRVANESADHALYLRLSDSEADMARLRSSAK